MPQSQRKALLMIFFATLIIASFIFWQGCGLVGLFGISFPKTIFEYLQFCFLFISLTLAYITTYSAIEVDSPSLIIVLKVNLAGAQGLSKEALGNKMNDEVLIMPRVQDLLSDNMIFFDEGKYKLTAKGNFLAGIFVFYRKLLGLEKGG